MSTGTGWDQAFDTFEASLEALDSALERAEWDGLVVATLPVDGLSMNDMSPAQRARLHALQARWRGLEPELVRALHTVEHEIAQIADTRKAVAGYASAGASFSA